MNRYISQFLEFYRRKEKPRGLDFDHFPEPLFYLNQLVLSVHSLRQVKRLENMGIFLPKSCKIYIFPTFLGVFKLVFVEILNQEV